MKKYFLVCMSMIALLCVGCNKSEVDYMEPKTNVNDSQIEENKQNYETVESGETLIEKEENLLNESSRRIRNRNRNY